MPDVRCSIHQLLIFFLFLQVVSSSSRAGVMGDTSSFPPPLAVWHPGPTLLWGKKMRRGWKGLRRRERWPSGGEVKARQGWRTRQLFVCGSGALNSPVCRYGNFYLSSHSFLRYSLCPRFSYSTDFATMGERWNGGQHAIEKKKSEGCSSGISGKRVIKRVSWPLEFFFRNAN